MMQSMTLKIIQLYVVFLFVVASRWGLPSQGAGQPLGGQKSPFPPPAGGLGRLQLRRSGVYRISINQTHTLVSIHTCGVYYLKTRGVTKWAVCPPCTFRKERRKRENTWGKRREGIKYFLTSGDACREAGWSRNGTEWAIRLLSTNWGLTRVLSKCLWL